MRVKTRQVITNYIDEINSHPGAWETRERGKIPGGPAYNWDTPGWREHMGKIFALRATKLAPVSDAKEFYRRMSMLSKELGFYMNWPKG
jgi:hypothetical protein